MAGTKSGFSADERAAMKQRAEELRTTKGLKGAAKLAKEFEACVAAIDALEGTDKAVATALHRIVLEVAPQLEPKTWYGFPSYAQGGKVVVFYQPASKFDSRYGTVGFQEDAHLDDGPMWPTSFAVIEVTDDVEKRLRDLVARAAG
ncbi:iron chaperone [Microbacterium lacticum]